MGLNEAKTAILENHTALGIEFGSTRIKQFWWTIRTSHRIRSL